ncbi:MAG: phosphoribosylanthranilate isomerase [Winogradskyella sp.]|uniref:phosphoribosylanthranilate isomerase n=1 Tax=Winogradskyella sp. TaxID=1883156 RepID=UPI0018326176|nr:phosphoribosylanthranilate isomerase [Winogradskyella sp.]
MRLKVCGMKHNTIDVAKLQPDYLGFIFYAKSPRNYEAKVIELPESIKKVGVFVNAPIQTVLDHINRYGLDVIQLHGNETAEYTRDLLRVLIDSSTKIPQFIKVFSIKDDFDFTQLKPFKDLVDYYLFDTKGKLPGGNGYTFNWDVLKHYPSTKPYFLSGGIGPDEIDKIKAFKQSEASKYCYAIDVNSKFETEPGLKNISALEKFKNEL